MMRHFPSGDDPFAASLRGFGPTGIFAMVVILAGNGLMAPFSAILVLVWAWRSATPWREIGYVRPTSWPATVLTGAALGVALKLAMKSIVMPLLGAPPVNQAYAYLAGNTAALPGMIFAVTAGAGFGEETVFRGYLFERLGRLFGPGKGPLIVLLTAAWFGVVHYPGQGTAGVQQALIVGLVFGAIFALTRRIWILIFAHAAFDLTALALIYFQWEIEVATFFIPNQ